MTDRVFKNLDTALLQIRHAVVDKVLAKKVASPGSQPSSARIDLGRASIKAELADSRANSADNTGKRDWFSKTVHRIRSWLRVGR